MAKSSEKELDKALEDGFQSRPGFTDWFLSQTKFADLGGHYQCSRSDNPWCGVPTTISDPDTGVEKQVVIESETDVLVVFETASKSRFALHIENKLALGRFTVHQPELYAARARFWMNKARYGNYSEFETVLVAPTAFYRRWATDAAKFDRFISHEDIARFLPVFLPQGP